MSWQFLSSKQALIKRAQLYKYIRKFFAQRDVLEVETPLLSKAGVTDCFINSFEVFEPNLNNVVNKKLYLQTSPEYAMKRLLCSDNSPDNSPDNSIGSIFQICKAFRAEEIGRNHNIEFSILEWYRINFDLDELMNEMAELLSNVLFNNYYQDKILKITYRDLFIKYLEFDYNDYNLVDHEFLKNLIIKLFGDQFNTIIKHNDFDVLYNTDDLLTILLSNYIEPILAETEKDKIIFLYNYPVTQAALAKLDYCDGYQVAKRFEVYFNGLELANGFQELSDPVEQEIRFNLDLERRKLLGLPMVNIDYNLLSALKHGLPACSGVALGLDRLLMLQMGVDNIEDVLTFRF